MHMEEEQPEVKTGIMEDWPISNYPILLALMLLVVIAISIGLGNSETSNQLAIYTYLLLFFGVAIRFLELTLPETLIQRITEKISLKKGIDNRKENKFDYLADVTKNVFVFLLVFVFIALGYGV